MKRLIRPIAHTTRSILGVAGLLSRLADTDRQLSETASNVEIPLARNETLPPSSIAALGYAALTGNPAIPVTPPTSIRAGSRMCRQGDFSTDGFRYWITRMRHPLGMQRKLWEWFFIADALFQRGQLAPGRHGIGFGVGLEPLSPVFASMGCDILATDMPEHGTTVEQWAGQHAANLDALKALGLCDDATFQRNLRFRPIDMNELPSELNEQFDFCWSSCAFEHLGSIERGLQFVEGAMALLKPGGVAVHTTEFNMSSNDDTFEHPDLSLYRRRDLEMLFGRLERSNHHTEPMDWDQGHGYADGYIDLPPYTIEPLHLRLRIANYDCTSIGIILHRAGDEIS